MSDSSRSRLTVLYVDDEELARKYFVRVVGPDYTVQVAGGADEAMQTLRAGEGRIAIVMSDFRMPGRDGGALLRQVAREYPQTVRVLVTAYADKDMLLDTVNTADVFRILEKPLQRGVIRETLQLSIGRYYERAASHQRLMAIDETLAFLAHELNTPLATISMLARSLEASRGEAAGDAHGASHASEIGRAATSMRNNAQYCQAVIASFWRSVQGGGNRFPHDSLGRETGVRELIAALLDTYPFTGRQREWVEVEVKGDFFVQRQSNCVALVLSSLLSNALRVLVNSVAPSLRFVVLNTPHCEIHICDNGPGMPPEVMGRLLVDPVTTHASTGGSGWGMIFCKRVMQSLGGGIRVSSTLEAGTTVMLDFPTTRN